MTDIPALIAEVQRRIDEDGCGPEWTMGTSLDHRIIEALSRLTAIPLPEEIAGLIEGLTDILTGLKSGRFGQREIWEGHLKEAISRLAASALPGEIAGLIERAEAQAMSRWGGPNNEHKNCLEWHLAAALQRLARECERLREGWSAQSVRAEKAEARIAELELNRVRERLRP